MKCHPAFFVACITVFGIVHGISVSEDSPAKKNSAVAAGPGEDGFLLPNGWRLTPAGRHILLTDLPLNILTSPDSRYAYVATSGYNQHELTAIDLATGNKTATTSVAQSWFGLAADLAEGRFWWSGGGEGSLHHFGWVEGQFQPLESPLPLFRERHRGFQASGSSGLP